MVASKGLSNCSTSHLEHWCLSAVIDVDKLIDVLNLAADREVVGSWLLIRFPVVIKDTSIIRVRITRNFHDVTHDGRASVTLLTIGPCRICQVLFASLLESCNLWHVAVIENVESFRDDMHMGTLSNRCGVGIPAKRCLKVKVC